MAGASQSKDDRLVPYVMFTDPPLARVGLSEGEAQRMGTAVRVAKLPMSKVLRTEATDETQGFMKVVVSANDDRILGFTMIGSEAGEVMARSRRRYWLGSPRRRAPDSSRGARTPSVERAVSTISSPNSITSRTPRSTSPSWKCRGSRVDRSVRPQFDARPRQSPQYRQSHFLKRHTGVSAELLYLVIQE